MPRSTRLFEILQILRQAEAPVTAGAIAERLEVTPRTIYRDIAALHAMRLPIVGEAGVGYIMRPGFDLPPLMFTIEEVEAIATGLALLGRTKDDGLVKAADSAMAKIADVLPERTGRAAAIETSDWSAVPASSIAPASMRAHIRNCAELRIAYRDQQGSRSERTIKPLALIYHIEATLLAAWCAERQDFRHFRLDRIDACTATGQSFSDEADDLLKRWRSESEPLVRRRP